MIILSDLDRKTELLQRNRGLLEEARLQRLKDEAKNLGEQPEKSPLSPIEDDEGPENVGDEAIDQLLSKALKLLVERLEKESSVFGR